MKELENIKINKIQQIFLLVLYQNNSKPMSKGKLCALAYLICKTDKKLRRSKSVRDFMRWYEKYGLILLAEEAEMERKNKKR